MTIGADINNPGTSTTPIVKNPKDFGAKWDGVTDDTVPIQEAHDAAEAVRGVLWLPEGTGRTKGLLWGSGVHIDGPGELKLVDHTKLEVGKQGDVICSKGFAALASTKIGGAVVGEGVSEGGITRCSIGRRVRLNGNKANQAVGEGGAGVRIYGYGYKIEAQIRNCVEWPLVSEWTGSYGEAEGDSMEALIADSKMHNCGKGVYFNGPHDSTLRNVIPHKLATGAIGIELGPKAPGCSLDDCHPWAENEEPLSVGILVRPTGCTITGGEVEGFYNAHVGIKILANKTIVEAGQLFTGKTNGVGIQLGSKTEKANGEAGEVTASACRIRGIIFDCSEGPINYVNSNENDVEITVFSPSATAVAAGAMGSKDRLRYLWKGEWFDSNERRQFKTTGMPAVAAGATSAAVLIEWGLPFPDNEYTATIGIKHPVPGLVASYTRITGGKGVEVFFFNPTAAAITPEAISVLARRNIAV